MDTASSFLSEREVAELGFATVGRSVRISRFARFYGASRVRLGDEVRIDDFAVLSAGPAGIALEGHNHIAVSAFVFGEVTFRPWSTLSSRAAIYSTTDDFAIDTHTYPHAARGRVLVEGPVVIGSLVVIGTGSTVLPGVTITDGVSVGAMSLVTRSIDVPGVYAGVPARFLKPRVPLDNTDAVPT
jgi:dTDP-4-amino-4,6-dideoxy-D-glucose acyltransferase